MEQIKGVSLRHQRKEGERHGESDEGEHDTCSESGGAGARIGIVCLRGDVRSAIRRGVF